MFARGWLVGVAVLLGVLVGVWGSGAVGLWVDRVVLKDEGE